MLHWTQQRERTSARGMAFLVAIMKWTGPRVVKLLVVPVALYYFLTSPNTRKASATYFLHLIKAGSRYRVPCNLPSKSLGWLGFRHVLTFSWSMVDRVYFWAAGAAMIRYQIEGKALFERVLNRAKPGALFLVSHLGNFDLAIVGSDKAAQKQFNIIMDTSRSLTFNQFRDKIYQSGQVHFVQPQAITPITIMSLAERVANGDIVVIAADRTPHTQGKNSVLVDFLGESARFPVGPYILAHLLQVPVYTLLAFKHNDGCLIRFELFAEKVVLRHKQRQQMLGQYAQKFADMLARECCRYPFQWYNFYDFWHQDAVTERPH